MKRDDNKDQLIKLLCDINHGCPTLHLIGKEQSMFNHEEADVNIVSCLLSLHVEKRVVFWTFLWVFALLSGVCSSYSPLQVKEITA